MKTKELDHAKREVISAAYYAILGLIVEATANKE